MASRIHSLGSCLIVLTLLLFAGSAAAQDVSPRCEAAMDRAGLDMPRGFFVHTLEAAQRHQAELGYPTIVRPSFTMGGSGGGIAYNADEFERIISHGLDLSPIDEVLIEEAVIGWKEYELEVMRDRNDNVVNICSIENIDPMGVHTGDS